MRLSTAVALLALGAVAALAGLSACHSSHQQPAPAALRRRGVPSQLGCRPGGFRVQCSGFERRPGGFRVGRAGFKCPGGDELPARHEGDPRRHLLGGVTEGHRLARGEPALPDQGRRLLPRHHRGHGRRLRGLRENRRLQAGLRQAALLQRPPEGSRRASDQLRRLAHGARLLRLEAPPASNRSGVGVRRKRRHRVPQVLLGQPGTRRPHVLEAPRRLVPGQELRGWRLRPLRHDRQRLGMDQHLVRAVPVAAGALAHQGLPRRKLEPALRQVDGHQAAGSHAAEQVGLAPRHSAARSRCPIPNARSGAPPMVRSACSRSPR